jgi:hypothetical protein
MLHNKKGQLMHALNELPAAIIAFVIFAIVTVVGFKIINGLVGTLTQVTIVDNYTYNGTVNILNAMSNFSTNAGLLAVITVMAVVLMVVISAFSFRKSY